MSGARVFLLSEAKAQPWRNGGGLTRELLAWPSADAWSVRFSVADIEADGPFSSFPGVQRWFAVLEGPGVELGIDGTTHCLRPGDAPLNFDGAATTTCRLLGGPTRDLNLMLREAAGQMRPCVAGQPWQPEATQGGLFTAVAGRCVLASGEMRLPEHALLWFDAMPPSLVFVPDAPPALTPGWWIAATPHSMESSR